MAVCTIKSLSIGGPGGAPFPYQYVSSLALRTGAWMDNISIGGQAHGGPGGAPGKTLTLADDEYIDSLTVATNANNAFVGYLKVTTNKGQVLEGGVNGGGAKVLADVRVIAIGGGAGQYVDRLEVLYIEGYSGPAPDPRYFYPLPDNDFTY